MKNLIFLFTLLLSVNSHATTVSGIILGERQVTLKSASQGVITEIKFQEGDIVKEGALIAVIDDRQERIERDMAASELKMAQQDYEKTKQLRKYVSEDEILKKQNEYVKKKSALDLKQYNLNNTRVIAPFDGILSKKNVEKGSTVSSGEKLFEVVQMENLIMDIYVSSKDAVNLKKGSMLAFKTSLHKDESFKAEIQTISPVIDSASGTIKVRLTIKNKQNPDKSFQFMPGTVSTIDL